jgi:general secretion pathway protein J
MGSVASAPRSGTEAGFTLVELLVAMTMLGLLTVLLFGGLRFGTRAWERGEAHSTGVDDVRFAEQFLRRELSDAYPLFVSAGTLQPHVSFEGDARSMSFLGPAPRSLSRAGRAQITLTAAASGKDTKLLVTARPELAFHDDDQATTTDVLIDGFKSLTFSYFGAEGPSDPPLWHERWHEQPARPKLIRIQGRFADGDARQWPDLIVAPEIDVDLACGYDALTRGCRGR